MRPRTPWDVAWAAWLAGVLGSFVALEAAALRHRRPTLSASLARWLGLHPRTPTGPWALLGFAGFWTWLCVHLARWAPGRAEERSRTVRLLVRLLEER